MSLRFDRRVVVPTILALILLANAVTPAHAHGHGGGGGGNASGGGHHSSGGGYPPGGSHFGRHTGGGRPASGAASTGGIPWNQPVMQPDQLPEARLARFVHHVFHPQGD